MKFIEKNLKNFTITRNGNFYDPIKNRYYYYHYACASCGYPYLSGYPYLNTKKYGEYCSIVCSRVIYIGDKHPMFNKKHKPESIQKNINSHIGKKDSEETKQKKRLSKLGNLNCFFNKKHTEETKRILSYKAKERLSDPTKNPRFIDGRSCSKNQYCSQWSDKEYKHYLLYERDGECFGPECNGKHLHKLVLHHINYDKKDCRPNNLIGVCVSCNSKANTDREWHEAYYNEIMRRRNR